MFLKQYPFITLAVLFSLKAIVLPDVASVALAVLWTAAHFLTHFYGTDTAKVRLENRISKFESDSNEKTEFLNTEIVELKTKFEQSNLAQSIRRTSF